MPPAQEVSRRAVFPMCGGVITAIKLPEALPSAAGARLAPSVGGAHSVTQVPRHQRDCAAEEA